MPHIVNFPKCAVCNESDDLRICPVCDAFVCREFIHISNSMGPSNTDMDTTCDHEHDVLTGTGWGVPIEPGDAGAAVPPEGMSRLRRPDTWRDSFGHSAWPDGDGARPAIHRPVRPVHGQHITDVGLAAIEDLCYQLTVLVEQLPDAGRNPTLQRAVSSGIELVQSATHYLAWTNRNLTAHRVRPQDQASTWQRVMESGVQLLRTDDEPPLGRAPGPVNGHGPVTPA